MEVLEATKIARNIIRSAKGNKRYIALYTNKYKNCRTVKCYAGNEETQRKIIQAVGKELPQATVKVIMSPTGIGKSLIVRIPN